MHLFRRFISIFAAAAVVTALAASVVRAQWPTTCVDLNDQSEAALGNYQNVGIYQRVFGDQAEAACRRDHLDDVQRTFWWAIPASVVPPPPPIPIPLAIHGVGPNVSEYRLIGPGRYLATTSWANNGGSTEATFCFAPVHFQAFLNDTDGNRADLTGDEFGCTGSVRSPVTVARATNVYVSVSHSWDTASWSVTFDKLD